MANLHQFDANRLFLAEKWPIWYLGSYQKSTVVIVSHQADILEAFCDSAAVLRDGKLIFFDTLEEAKQVYDYAQ